MRVKIKFQNPVSQEKFMHNLVNAKKVNGNYKHFQHKVLEEAKNKVSFRLSNDEGRTVVFIEMDFYPEENLVEIECQPCNFDQLQTLLVFDLLESINERAVVRFIDTKFFYDGGMDFYVVLNGKKGNICKVSTDKENLLEVTNAGIIGRIMAENDSVDLF